MDVGSSVAALVVMATGRLSSVEQVVGRCFASVSGSVVNIVSLTTGEDSCESFSFSSLATSSLSLPFTTMLLSVAAISKDSGPHSRVLNPVGSGLSLFLALLFCCLVFGFSDGELTLAGSGPAGPIWGCGSVPEELAGIAGGLVLVSASSV